MAMQGRRYRAGSEDIVYTECHKTCAHWGCIEGSTPPRPRCGHLDHRVARQGREASSNVDWIPVTEKDEHLVSLMQFSLFLRLVNQY